MKKTLLICCLSLVLVGSALVVAAPSLAAPPQGGCPAKWIGPVPSWLVLPAIDKGNFKDQNGDGLLCFRVPRGFCNNRGMGANAPVCGAWVWKDNTN